MKNVGFENLANRIGWLAAVALTAITMMTNTGMSTVLAQDSQDRIISQAQRAIRDQIISREGGRGQTVLFNRDASKENKSNLEVRVQGTGTLMGSNYSYGNNARDNTGRDGNQISRTFSYEAVVNNRYRNNANNVSGMRYDWNSGGAANGWGRSGNDRENSALSIYCASDNGRRHNCPVNINGGTVRLVNQRSGSNCVQGRNWGFNNTRIWVDRGCRADFEVSGGRSFDNNGYGNVNRPQGRVSYSGPIMNRRSDKALDVTERGMQDGANVQQWSYADQPNQNWDIIDLGNNEVAIITSTAAGS
ncbi:MAG: DUF3011 domain-containing protein [Acidobacteria bacterium]|nr:DUF3011 domain-containing protein [Acidobacteriota bacterium]